VQVNARSPAEQPVSPLVTVVIPTYNRMPLLLEAIHSVVAQNYTNWELFIADDGSTDGTIEAVRVMNDPRVRIIELSHTGNIGSLRNTGAQAGKGEWIAFLDSDDRWLPDKLQIQLNSLTASSRRWGYGAYELMGEFAGPIENRSRKFYPYCGWITKEIITAEAAVSIGTLTIERKLFNEAGGFSTNEKLIYREDYDLALRLSLKAEADAVPEVLVHIREHRGRSTNHVRDSFERMAETYTQFIKIKPGPTLEKIARKRRGYHLAEAAANNLSQKKYLLAGRQLGKALADGDRMKHVLSVLKRSVNRVSS